MKSKSNYKSVPVLFLSLAIAALLFGGCGQQSSNTAGKENPPAGSSIKTEDARLEEAVKDKLSKDPSLKDVKIDVESKDAIVDLRGTVPTLEIADHATQVAQSVDGVRTVNSYLAAESAENNNPAASDDSIKSEAEKVGNKLDQGLKEIGSETKDAAITAEVKMKLAGDDSVKASKIDVDTHNQTVVLKGTVSTKREAAKAVALARSVKDVVSVRSRLVVVPENGV